MNTDENAERANDPVEDLLRDLVPGEIEDATVDRIASEIAQAPRLGVIEGGRGGQGRDVHRAFRLRRLRAAAVAVAVVGLAVLAWRQAWDGMRSVASPVGATSSPAAPAGSSDPGAADRAFEAEGREAAGRAGGVQSVRFAPALDGVGDGGMIWREDGRPYRVINFDFADHYIIEPAPEAEGGAVRVTIPRREQLIVPVQSF